MSAIVQETEARGITTVTTGKAQLEFSQEYSKGELEEMGSLELLDGYAELEWPGADRGGILSEDHRVV